MVNARHYDWLNTIPGMPIASGVSINIRTKKNGAIDGQNQKWSTHGIITIFVLNNNREKNVRRTD